MNAITFQTTTFDVVDRNNQPWLRLPQIEGALGYTNKGKGLYNIYKAHADEFTDSMTAVIKLPTAGGEQETRIFSPRGCYALGMFARTRQAKAFRVWVLDVLEGKAAAPAIAAHATIAKTPMEGQLYQAVCTKTAGDGNARHWLWGRLNAHFALSSYKNLPVSQFDAAMQFVVSINIPAMQPAALPAPEPRREAPEELITRWMEPNSYLFEPEFLARLGQACFARLHNAVAYHRGRADGVAQGLRWSTPVAPEINDSPLHNTLHNKKAVSLQIS